MGPVPGRRLPLPVEGGPVMPFLHCTRNTVKGDQAGRSAAGLENSVKHRRTEENVVQGTAEGRTFAKRRRMQMKCKRNKGLRHKTAAMPAKRENSTRWPCETLGQKFELEAVKVAVALPCRLQKMRECTLWKSRPHPEWKKRRRRHVFSEK
jgi:hypothetical protein